MAAGSALGYWDNPTVVTTYVSGRLMLAVIGAVGQTEPSRQRRRAATKAVCRQFGGRLPTIIRLKEVGVTPAGEEGDGRGVGGRCVRPNNL
jgi:hypothetical protein